MKMPFGKHKGELLSEIPLEYLQWVISNLDISERLNDAIEDEFIKREDEENLSKGYGDYYER